MTCPFISIVVVNHNGRRYLKGCFDALLDIDYPEARYEVFMVDNLSRDGSSEYVKNNYKKITVIENDRNNYCMANNLGINRSQGRYIAFLNNDTRVTKSWLEELVRVIEGDALIGAVGSKLLYPDNKIQNAGHYEMTGFYFGERGAGKEAFEFNRIEEVVSLCGASALYRKECFEQLGAFDEDFLMYFEDVDMSFRIRQKGWKTLFVPDSIVYHEFHGTGSHALSRYFIERNRLLFIAKHYPEKLDDLIKDNVFLMNNRSFLSLLSGKLAKHHGQAAMDGFLSRLTGPYDKKYASDFHLMLSRERDDAVIKVAGLEHAERLNNTLEYELRRILRMIENTRSGTV